MARVSGFLRDLLVLLSEGGILLHQVQRDVHAAGAGVVFLLAHLVQETVVVVEMRHVGHGLGALDLHLVASLLVGLVVAARASLPELDLTAVFVTHAAELLHAVGFPPILERLELAAMLMVAEELLDRLRVGVGSTFHLAQLLDG